MRPAARQQPGADFEHQQRPRRPADQRDHAEHRNRRCAATQTPRADPHRDARQDHHRHRLPGCRWVGLHFLVNRRVQCCGTNEALEERVRTNTGSHARFGRIALPATDGLFLRNVDAGLEALPRIRRHHFGGTVTPVRPYVRQVRLVASPLI